MAATSAAAPVDTLNLVPDRNFSIPSMRGRIADRLGLLVMRYFRDFLRDFSTDGSILPQQAEGDEQQPERKYFRSLWEVVHEKKNTIAVDFKDIEMYNDNLAKAVLLHYYRCYPFLCQAVLNCIRDEFDIESVKESLTRRQIMVAFTNTPMQFNLRDLRCNLIGQLVRITGQVVRSTPVHPELTYGHFECELCGADIPEVEQQFRYVQPTRCSNERCQNTNKFKLNLSKSMCVDFQKVRVQETQAELPRGAVPRTLDVIVRGGAVETANPGDECHFYGCLLVVPDISALSGRQPSKVSFEPTSTFKHQPGMEREGVSGLKALGVRELTYRVVFLAHNCESSSVKYGGIGIDLSRATSIDYIRSVLSDADLAKLYEMSNDTQLWRSICDSLFPTIYGNDEIKKGVVLQLFGGVAKYTPEGTQLRGDINICIVGDPSTAKSQFLKQMQQFYPRAVYTSGKASTAAGLTAAVVKDEETHQFVIEAGALMLADRSICCIDEFDKMDIKDQVAIHEAMEQQTISIAKAGVKATLNARTSILAAANPIGGRYDKTKSLRQNVYLSAPIMSRFDLLFVLIDDCDEVVDRAVATRILDLHTGTLLEKKTRYSKEDVQRYIIFAKQFRPIIAPDAEDVLVKKYLQLRRRDRTAGYGGGAVRGAYRTTVRQLESLIRLSEAIARMQCLTQVTAAIVESAFELLSKSIVRVEEPDVVLTDADDAAAGTLRDAERGDERAELARNAAAGDRGQGGAGPAGVPMRFADYQQTSMKLLLRVSYCEKRQMDVHKSELVQWYLESIEEQIVDEADLAFKKLVTEKIVDHMIKFDRVLLEVTNKDLDSGDATAQPEVAAADDDAERQEKVEEAILIMHPNAHLPDNFMELQESYEMEQQPEGEVAAGVEDDDAAGNMDADDIPDR